MLINIWLNDKELLQMITSGDIAYELCRPQQLYALWFSKNLSNRLSGTLLRCLPILGTALFLPLKYRLSLPANGVAFFLFVLTLALGTILLISYMLLGYILAFYTISADGILWALVIVVEILSGQFVPIALYPTGIQDFFYKLPFAYINDFSFRIYSGNIGLEAAITGIIIQVLWLVTFIVAGNLLLKHAISKIIVQGG